MAQNRHRSLEPVFGTGTGSEVLSVERTEKGLFRSMSRDGGCDIVDMNATLLAKELVMNTKPADWLGPEPVDADSQTAKPAVDADSQTANPVDTELVDIYVAEMAKFKRECEVGEAYDVYDDDSESAYIPDTLDELLDSMCRNIYETTAWYNHRTFENFKAWYLKEKIELSGFFQCRMASKIEEINSEKHERERLPAQAYNEQKRVSYRRANKEQARLRVLAEETKDALTVV
jgi:hypothetical protein